MKQTSFLLVSHLNPRGQSQSIGSANNNTNNCCCYSRVIRMPTDNSGEKW